MFRAMNTRIDQFSVSKFKISGRILMLKIRIPRVELLEMEEPP